MSNAQTITSTRSVAIFGASGQVGQRLAHDQMHTLYDRMSAALTGTATPSAAPAQEPTTEPTP